MKYYLIAGEASGDLHAANLMKELKKADPKAEFRFFGGDNMAKIGGDLVKHYKELAYMGFIPVLMHLKTIFRNMKTCKEDVMMFAPDALILIDYPGFNLSIAEYVAKNSNIPVYYYISPKIWAWKEYRIKNIKRDIKSLFSILPFEIDFFKKHNYSINYVGNPTAEEVRDFKSSYKESFKEFAQRHSLSEKPIIAVLAGSRKQEIKSNLPKMLEALKNFPNHQIVIAGAPGISPDYYAQILKDNRVDIIFGETYKILSHAQAALVTSGTATLETALFRVPQAVCYSIGGGRFTRLMKKLFLKVKYISLVNLIADKEVVRELIADQMNARTITNELKAMINNSEYRNRMICDYETVSQKLGNNRAAETTARLIIDDITRK